MQSLSQRFGRPQTLGNWMRVDVKFGCDPDQSFSLSWGGSPPYLAVIFSIPVSGLNPLPRLGIRSEKPNQFQVKVMDNEGHIRMDSSLSEYYFISEVFKINLRLFWIQPYLWKPFLPVSKSPDLLLGWLLPCWC